MPTPTTTPAKATGTSSKSTTSSSSRTAQTGNAANNTSRAAASLKAAVAPKGTAPAKAAAPPKSDRGNSSVQVEWLNNRIVFHEYQKGDIIEIIEEAAAQLGMSGKVVAAALSHEADQGNNGKSTWKVELRKPLVGNCEQLFVIRVRTSHEVPSLFGRK